MTERATAECVRMPDNGNYHQWKVIVRSEDTGEMAAYEITTDREDQAVTEAFRRFEAREK